MFANKRVLVTGGGRGLGLCIATQFQLSGATILILDKDPTLLTQVKQQNPTWTTIQADLLNWDETNKALANIEPCHHIVNNAGVNFRQDLLDVTEDKVDFILGVNFKSIINVTQIMVKKMIASKIEGTIVNIASYAAKHALPSISIYSASKAAVVSLTKSMALEFAEYKIRANCVCPTYMITDFTKEYIEKNPERFEAILSKQCFREFLDPVECAKIVLFLSSGDCSMVNGSSLDVDGGVV